VVRLVSPALAGVVVTAVVGCGPVRDRGAQAGRSVVAVIRAIPTPTPIPTRKVTSFMVDSWYSRFYNLCVPSMASSRLEFLRCINGLHDDIVPLNLLAVDEVAKLLADLDNLDSCVQFLRCNWGDGGPEAIGKAVHDDFGALKVLTGENATAI
jgi:hypothetical protein